MFCRQLFAVTSCFVLISQKIENLLDMSKISVKFCITYDNGYRNCGKFKHRVIPDSSKHICAMLTRRYNIVKYSIDVYLFGDHCDITFHCSRSNNEINFLETEKQLFVDCGVTKMLLVSMHEQQCECFAENKVELCFADNYLMSFILRHMTHVFYQKIDSFAFPFLHPTTL
jgi:hypothetical protein